MTHRIRLAAGILAAVVPLTVSAAQPPTLLCKTVRQIKFQSVGKNNGTPELQGSVWRFVNTEYGYTIVEFDGSVEAAFGRFQWVEGPFGTWSAHGPLVLANFSRDLSKGHMVTLSRGLMNSYELACTATDS